jgi:Na+-transporting methylmalonyl-CoA/oxaloacetate decarboxylase gamma subunit
MSKKISNVALLTFEGVAFNVTFLALLLILVYPLSSNDVLRFIYTPYL